MKLFFASLILLFTSLSYSQDSIWNKKSDTNSVIVYKDQRLDLLVKKHAEFNEEMSRNAKKNTKGFRILVVNTNNRDEAIAAKSKVYANFPELKAYLIYQSPYFRLKVGNFKERKDAEDYQKKMNKLFPKGVFIMNDTIEIKPDKDNTTSEPGT
jgi:hypothetical protein